MILSMLGVKQLDLTFWIVHPTVMWKADLRGDAGVRRPREENLGW